MKKITIILLLLLLASVIAYMQYSSSFCKENKHLQKNHNLDSINDTSRVLIDSLQLIENDSNSRERIIVCCENLKGRNNMEYLANNFQDTRPSISFRAVSSATIGSLCEELVKQQLLPFWIPCGRMMFDSTGNYCPSPWIDAELSIFQKTPLATWIKDRKNRSLEQLQLEVVDALILDFEKIGFYDKSGNFDAQRKEKIMTPLREFKLKLSASQDK